MAKSFSYFKKNNRASNSSSSISDDKPQVFKYSVYMQSRDSTWLNRNLNNSLDEDPEPLEEDIRD